VQDGRRLPALHADGALRRLSHQNLQGLPGGWSKAAGQRRGASRRAAALASDRLAVAQPGVRRQHLWLNPAYGVKCRAIGPTLERVIAGPVRQRGCWLVALLPVHSFKTWFHTSVQQAHEVHYLRDKAAFLNPFMSEQGEYIAPLIVAIWRSGQPPDEAPRWAPSAAQPPSPDALASPADQIRVRRCRRCAAWWLLPRHQVDEPAEGAFECGSIRDTRRASCAGRHCVLVGLDR
jgi:hypothetical protein